MRNAAEDWNENKINQIAEKRRFFLLFLNSSAFLWAEKFPCKLKQKTRIRLSRILTENFPLFPPISHFNFELCSSLPSPILFSVSRFNELSAERKAEDLIEKSRLNELLLLLQWRWVLSNVAELFIWWRLGSVPKVNTEQMQHLARPNKEVNVNTMPSMELGRSQWILIFLFFTRLDTIKFLFNSLHSRRRRWRWEFPFNLLRIQDCWWERSNIYNVLIQRSFSPSSMCVIKQLKYISFLMCLRVKSNHRMSMRPNTIPTSIHLHAISNWLTNFIFFLHFIFISSSPRLHHPCSHQMSIKNWAQNWVSTKHNR